MKATGYGIAAAGFAIASTMTTNDVSSILFQSWALLLVVGLVATKAASGEVGK
jgi:hypothetical protein